MSSPILIDAPSFGSIGNVRSFSPAGNPVIFNFSGSSTGLVFFKTQVVELKTLGTIYLGNTFPTPVNPTIASINLSSQLSSVVRSNVDNKDVLILEKPQNIVGYKVLVTEWGLSGGTGDTMTALSPAYTGSTNYAFEAELDVFSFNSKFTGSTYVANSATTTTAKFLTNQPDFKPVNAYSFEQLYLLQDENPSLKLEYTIGNNTYQSTFTGTNIQFLLSAATPEVRAKAYLALTGFGAAYDNIAISADTGGGGGANRLGYYVSNWSGNTPANMAGGLATSCFLNSFGYTFNYTMGNNWMEILAPVGLGAAGNSITLTANRYATGYTTTVITAETRAIAIVSGYTWQPDTTHFTIKTNDLSNFITLVDGNVSNPAATTSAYTDIIVSSGNSNTFGYSFARVSNDAFSVTYRAGFGDTANGLPVYIYNQNNESQIGYYASGVTLGTALVTYSSATLPYSITGFTGGRTATPNVYYNSMERMVRINTSPKKLLLSGYTGFTIGQPYSVRVKNASGITMTEDRNYVYQDTDCNLNYVNVVFTNSFGGADSYQFVEPQESVVSNKLSVKKNSINVAASNIYITDGVYNPSDVTYKNTTKSNIKVYTKPLTDAESAWLVELVNSKNIYIELTDGNMVPVQLVNTNYNVQKNKYIREANQYQFEFSFSDNYLPALGGGKIIINQ